MNTTNVLLRHNFIAIPAPGSDTVVGATEAIATILMNLSYYGKALSQEGYKKLLHLSGDDLVSWWQTVETELKALSGADRKMGDFVVYKNFPAEVLEKSAAEYWLPQILMYWGFPKELFTQEVKPREKMNEQPKALVLKLASKDALNGILTSYLKSPARWKDEEFQDVLFLSESLPIQLSKVSFKENLVSLATFMMNAGKKVGLTTATDVLRLAAGLSDGDISLKENFKFISFKKPVRKYLLSAMEESSNLSEDVARRPELFKRLLHQLHPGDFRRQFPQVWQVADDLYNDRLETFNSSVEMMLTAKDANVLDLLATRPGDFRRRLVHTLDLFGNKAVKAFVAPEVLSKLTTSQIVSLRSFLETLNERQHRVFPPKGNWSKLQIGEPRPVAKAHIKAVSKALGAVLAERVPTVKVLDAETAKVKLPSNDGEVSPYNRGTVFPIPDGIQFIRTASYWKAKNHGTIWFDNGWNFFDSNWKSQGAISWNSPQFTNGAAAFSGDPLNSQDVEGRACQVIDLYLDKLVKQGIRYAVWNVLCFSHIAFSQAEEVFSALQWGEDAQKGKLFEPARSQLAFPLKGDSMTKFIVLVDMVKREMVYLDANLAGNVSGATHNGALLEKTMPAFMEYINSLPSVHDLFRESVDEDSDGAHILYSDKDAELRDNVPAYVFRPENKESKYKSVDINSLLT